MPETELTTRRALAVNAACLGLRTEALESGQVTEALVNAAALYADLCRLNAFKGPSDPRCQCSGCRLERALIALGLLTPDECRRPLRGG